MSYICGLENISSADRILTGKRLGLLTNPSGLDSSFRTTVDVLREKYRLTVLFAPEHGIRGELQAGAKVDGTVDIKTGLPVRSLFGLTNSPDLSDLDCLLYDIQDVGLRFYTYPYAMADAMEEAAKQGIPFIVLDRYNPLGLTETEGTVLKDAYSSGVGRFGLPSRYAMTVGELAHYINEEYKIGADLTVVSCRDLCRTDDFRSLSLPWIPTSPNLPTYTSLLFYIGTVLFEGTNLSEGRGTTKPFETVGAPWLDADRVVSELSSHAFKGVSFRTVFFEPVFSKYKGELCKGLQFYLTNPSSFESFRFGLTLLKIIEHIHPDRFSYIPENRPFIDHLTGGDSVRHLSLSDIPSFCERCREEREAFSKKIIPYLIYR